MPCCGIIIMCALSPPFKFHEQKGVLEAIKLSPEIWGKNKTGRVRTPASSIPEGGGGHLNVPSNALPLPRLPGMRLVPPPLEGGGS